MKRNLTVKKKNEKKTTFWRKKSPNDTSLSAYRCCLFDRSDDDADDDADDDDDDNSNNDYAKRYVCKKNIMIYVVNLLLTFMHTYVCICTHIHIYLFFTFYLKQKKVNKIPLNFQLTSRTERILLLFELSCCLDSRLCCQTIHIYM